MNDEPAKVQNLMRGFARDWFICGGWAIDLFLGRQTRARADVEIAIFREDQFALQKYLGDWDLRIAHDGALSGWKPGEFIELPVHGIHCFKNGGELAFLEVLLNERDAQHWRFRRDLRITKPLTELYLTNDSGLRFFAPEVVLLYKSKDPRDKDEQDFGAAVEHLPEERGKWLADALRLCYEDHHWLKKL